MRNTKYAIIIDENSSFFFFDQIFALMVNILISEILTSGGRWSYWRFNTGSPVHLLVFKNIRLCELNFARLCNLFPSYFMSFAGIWKITTCHRCPGGYSDTSTSLICESSLSISALHCLLATLSLLYLPPSRRHNPNIHMHTRKHTDTQNMQHLRWTVILWQCKFLSCTLSPLPVSFTFLIND